LGVEFTAVAQSDRPLLAGESIDVQLRSASHGTVPVTGIGGSAVQRLTVPAGTSPMRAYFARDSITRNRYSVSDAASNGRPWAAPSFVSTLEYRVGDVPVRVTTPIVYRQPQP